MSEQFKTSLDKFNVEENEEFLLENEFLELEDDQNLLEDEQMNEHEELEFPEPEKRNSRKSSSNLLPIPEETNSDKFWNDIKSGEPSMEKLSDVEIDLVEVESDVELLAETIENTEPPQELGIEIQENVEEFDEPFYEESEISVEVDQESASLRLSSDDSEKIETPEISLSEQHSSDHLFNLPTDQKELHELYEQLLLEKAEVYQRNSILNKCLFKYFERKMGYALEDQPSEVPLYLDKYDQTLEDYTNAVTLLGTLESQFKEDNKDVLGRMAEKEQSNQIVANDFKQRIKEIGLEVQNSKTGHKLSEKSIDKLISRLMQSYENLYSIRLKYIKTERTMLDLKSQNDELNNLGDGFKMEDFESLHHEADLISSKIDSKEDELTKLRKKCEENTQIMAHLEEKQCLILMDIQELEEQYFFKKTEENQMKEQLNKLINEKEKYRVKLADLEVSTGLMNHQILLKKYDELDGQIQAMTIELDCLLDKNKNLKEAIANHVRMPDMKAKRVSFV